MSLLYINEIISNNFNFVRYGFVIIVRYFNYACSRYDWGTMEEETFGDFASDALYDSQNDSQSMDAMSDMVQSMAAQIYAEFERLIGAYGDGVVESLMPQLVGILENWDKSLKEKQSVQLELDLTKEDNDQLLNQYEREKQLRKAADQVVR